MLLDDWQYRQLKELYIKPLRKIFPPNSFMLAALHFGSAILARLAPMVQHALRACSEEAPSRGSNFAIMRPISPKSTPEICAG